MMNLFFSLLSSGGHVFLNTAIIPFVFHPYIRGLAVAPTSQTLSSTSSVSVGVLHAPGYPPYPLQSNNHLACTRYLGLQFGSDNDLRVASDASFAHNTLDRKSSQAFAMKLFGGMIGWRANRQDMVTTWTTEAELLALA